MVNVEAVRRILASVPDEKVMVRLHAEGYDLVMLNLAELKQALETGPVTGSVKIVPEPEPEEPSSLKRRK